MTADEKMLIKMAFIEARNAKTQISDPVVSSARHQRIMRHILRYGERPRGVRLSGKLIALLVAAALLLLVGCAALAIHLGWVDFVTQQLAGYVRVSYDVENVVQTEPPVLVEHSYEPAFVPTGYLETERVEFPIHFGLCWENGDGRELIYHQRTLGGVQYAVDDENGELKRLEVDGKEIFVRHEDSADYYIWSDGQYSYSIMSDGTVEESEVKRMIASVK